MIVLQQVKGSLVRSDRKVALLFFTLTGEDEEELGGHDGNEEDDEEDLGFMVLVDGLEGHTPHEAF